MADGLSSLYQDLVSGGYDCIDRIVLNAYFRMGHDAGWFRLWRALTRSDDTLENAHLMSLAGRFSRRIRRRRKSLKGYFSSCRSRPSAGVGCQREPLHRAQEADAIREPLLVSYPRPGLGPHSP